MPEIETSRIETLPDIHQFTESGDSRLPPPGLDDVRLVENGTIYYRGLDDHCDRDLSFHLPYLSDCVAVRVLSDGRLLALRPTLFGSQLCVGAAERLSGDWGAWDDVWDYETLLTGYVGLAAWEPIVEGQPEQDAEPTGWIRHPSSGRRRKGGDPATEEVRA